MVFEEWGNRLPGTPVYPLRRGQEEYPAAAPDRRGMTACPELDRSVLRRQVSMVVRLGPRI